MHRSFHSTALSASASSLKSFNSDGIGRGVTILPKSEEYTNVIFWMHGLGDTADGWASLMPMLNLPGNNVKFILPTAEDRPITLNGGYSMPGWCDVKGLDRDADEDAEGFEYSAKRVQELIDLEIDKGIEPKNIIVGGFSQGGALAFHLTLRSEHEFAGCIALSTWVPMHREYPNVLSETAKKTLKVFQAHGDEDQVVGLQWGEKSHHMLKEVLDNEPSFLVIPQMGHSSDPKEIAAVRSKIIDWLKLE